MPNPEKSICVYCGSADSLDVKYLDDARRIGQLIAQRGITLVYGGGKTGMMGALADSALAAHGNVIGIVPENLNQPKLIHAGLSRLEVVSDIHVRKARMSFLADAFIALPGGYGTLDELFETLTWLQIGIHVKPVGILNTDGYYDPLLAMVERASRDHFIFDEHRELLVSSRDPVDLLTRIESFKLPSGLERWVNR